MILVEVEKYFKNENKFCLSVSFSIKKNEFIVITGKSGSGKTTLLRCIAGLEKPDRGIIKINDKIFYSSKENIFLPTQKRKIGMVFQSYALFPNKTVYQNIIYGCKKYDEHFIKEIIEVFELKDMLNRFPSTLSGGQKQRVALARTIAYKPELLLLDEPLSALDFSLRKKLQEQLKLIHRNFQLTTILVSHDIPEMIKLADRIIFLENGKIQKFATPQEIFFGNHLTPKFSFFGQIVDIIPLDVVFLAQILVDHYFVQVVVSKEDIKEFQIGDKVFIGSKGFNPIIIKME